MLLDFVCKQKVLVSLFQKLQVRYRIFSVKGFPGVSVGKESSCNAGGTGLIPGSGRSPGGGHGNPLSILAGRIPWTEEPGGPQSMGSKRVGHKLKQLSMNAHVLLSKTQRKGNYAMITIILFPRDNWGF